MAEDDDSRLDEAARAGWLYYIAGKTQDDIARTLNVSRPTAQRLVSLCRSEGLITFRMDHPIAKCMELASRLKDRFELVHCEIVPADGTAATAFAGMAEATAVFIERFFRANKAVVMALGTGRSMRASVERVAPMSRPLHRLVSIVGNISPDGSASPFDAVVKLAEITKAQHFPMPLPMHVASQAQRAQLLEIEYVRRIVSIAAEADVWLAGISQIDQNALLYQDGFISRDELFELIRLGAVGEVAGWAFNAAGEILQQGTNTRITSVPPQPGSARPRICVACGPAKIEPLRAALAGRVMNGVVTDESTAAALLGG
jgi:DNA-binding transcriptional regulator LsrR (DeoR family)